MTCCFSKIYGLNNSPVQKILPYKFYTFDVLNVHICVLKSSVAFSQLNDSEFYSVT